jgi:hypothetical protein
MSLEDKKISLQWTSQADSLQLWMKCTLLDYEEIPFSQDWKVDWVILQSNVIGREISFTVDHILDREEIQTLFSQAMQESDEFVSVLPKKKRRGRRPSNYKPEIQWPPPGTLRCRLEFKLVIEEDASLESIFQQQNKEYVDVQWNHVESMIEDKALSDHVEMEEVIASGDVEMEEELASGGVEMKPVQESEEEIAGGTFANEDEEEIAGGTFDIFPGEKELDESEEEEVHPKRRKNKSLGRRRRSNIYDSSEEEQAKKTPRQRRKSSKPSSPVVSQEEPSPPEPSSLDQSPSTPSKQANMIEIPHYMQPKPLSWYFAMKFGDMLDVHHTATGAKKEEGWHGARLLYYVVDENHSRILMRIHYIGHARTQDRTLNISRPVEFSDEEWLDIMETMYRPFSGIAKMGVMVEPDAWWDPSSPQCILTGKRKEKALSGAMVIDVKK